MPKRTARPSSAAGYYMLSQSTVEVFRPSPASSSSHRFRGRPGLECHFARTIPPLSRISPIAVAE